MHIRTMLLSEGWPLSLVATFVAIVAVAYVLVHQASTRKIDDREPPIVASVIPFVGHILGMALYGGKYIKNLGCGHALSETRRHYF
jgi:uncharacterized membrane protein